MEQQPNAIDNFFDALPHAKVIAFTAGAICTAVITTLFRRFQNRIVRLNSKITHIRIGQASKDVFGGEVKVTFKDKPVQGLYLTEVSITNTTIVDIDVINIALEYKNGEQIYGATAEVLGHPTPLTFSDEFQRKVDKLIESGNVNVETSPDYKYIARVREFKIPVLNRGEKVVLNVLTHSELLPHLFISCMHKGVCITEEKEALRLFTIPIQTASLFGLTFCAFLLLIFYSYIPSVGWASLIAFTSGSTCAIIGAGLLWGANAAIKMLR